MFSLVGHLRNSYRKIFHRVVGHSLGGAGVKSYVNVGQILDFKFTACSSSWLLHAGILQNAYEMK